VGTVECLLQLFSTETVLRKQGKTRLRAGRPVVRGLIFLGGRKFSVLDGVSSASGYQAAIGTVGTGAFFSEVKAPGT